MRVDVLIFDGCPNIETTLERARSAIAAANIEADLRLVRVADDAEAQRLGFLGSPTVRVDGADVDRGAAARDDFGMQCRIYSVDGRYDRAPPVDWIIGALKGKESEGASSSPPRGCCAGGTEDEP
jgi:hypothetical protein